MIMNILITGGTGFVGINLIPLFLKNGHNVSVLCRDRQKAIKLLDHRVKIIIGDVIDKDSIKGCCRHIDVVYHMVAKVGNDLPSDKTLAAFRKVNVVGTTNMVEEAKKNNVKKFIFISSIAAMGIVKEGIITENSPCTPYLPYQISKWEAEQVVNDAFKKGGLHTMIIRPTKVYGYGEREYSYLSLCKLCKRGFFPKIGTGRNMTCHLYISDLIDALYNSLNGGISGETYILASKGSVSLTESARIIAQEINKPIYFIYIPTFLMVTMAFIAEHFFLMLGSRPPVTKRNVMATVSDRIYDISKSERDLNFYPKITMKEGIKKVVAYYKELHLI